MQTQPQGKMYVVVRTDIQKRWWAPQACHAAMQFCIDHSGKMPIMGWSHSNKEPGTLVILGCPDSKEFEYLVDVASETRTVFSTYYEPFLQTKTAFAFICEGEMSQHTRHLDLLKF